MQRFKSSTIVAPISRDIGEGNKPVEWLLDETVISWDGGNGVSSAWQLVSGDLKWASLPNVRVEVTGYKFNSSVAVKQADITYADVFDKDGNEQRYGIGDGVWELSQYQPETFSNSEARYGSPIHIFMLLNLLAILDAPEAVPLTIVTSAPPSYINKVGKKIKQELLYGEKRDKSGLWRIRMSWDKQPRTYHIDKVVVLPEGHGSYSAYAFDANGNTVEIPRPDNEGFDFLMGNVAIHDGGNGTYDMYMIRNGAVIPDSISKATDDQFGIQAQMIEPLMDIIYDEFYKAGEPRPNLNKAQIDGWIRDWSAASGTAAKEKAARVMVNGRYLQLHEPLRLLSERYAQRVIQEKLEYSFRQGADTILATGGMWELVMNDIQRHYKKRMNRILTPAQAPHLTGIPIWELNAYGMLVSAALDAKVKRKV